MLVERRPAKPGVLVVTYIAEHCHAVPTMLNALAGTTRHRSASSDGDGHQASHGASDEASAGRRKEDSADASSMTVDGGGGAEMADDENEPWQQADMALDDYPLDLDDFLGPFEDGFDRFFEDDDGVLERRVSL
ncbi:probable WRKY transcription factor 14 [Setaria italica]|uniref:WRKY domain-containing protein n=1 Tax=Setaria italica TaxID=4555 RepID=K4A0V1_SETIT|nr:probable WRKY transcription factor 14 [Setaria italica]